MKTFYEKALDKVETVTDNRLRMGRFDRVGSGGIVSLNGKQGSCKVEL